MSGTYRSGLQALYDGEVMGERLLLALHAAARTPRQARHFAAILQLETETKARLRPLLLRQGMSLAETADLGGVPGRVEDYRRLDWRAWTAASAERLAPIVVRYTAIAALGPAADQSELAAVVAHEAALLRWAEMEAGGETEASLDAILALLRFPPF